MTSYVAVPYKSAQFSLARPAESDIEGKGNRNDEDHQIVQRLQRRDQSAMTDLYDKYGGLLYSIILRSVKSAPVAEDLVQEVMLRVWNRIGQFDVRRGRLSSWLVTIARNRAVDQLRSLRSQPNESNAGWAECEKSNFLVWQDTSAERLCTCRSVNGALSRLNCQQREILELTHFEGLTQTEIAERLNKPLGTVKSLVRSAVKVMRAHLMASTQ